MFKISSVMSYRNFESGFLVVSNYKFISVSGYKKPAPGFGHLLSTSHNP
jgi:hypothetical protein